MTLRDAAHLVRQTLRHAGGREPDPELVEELAQHLVQLFEDGLRKGLPAEEAAAEALKRLETPPAVARDIDAARRPPVSRRLSDWGRQEPPAGGERNSLMHWTNFSQDARYAVRMLFRSPIFSLAAIATFAVGIGVNTAVFSVVHGVLVRPLPYPDADRIAFVWMDNRRQGIKEDITSYPNYRDWRDQSGSFAHMAAFTRASFNLSGAGEPERLIGAQTTANFFDVMGVQPVVGRVFTEANEMPGSDAVVVLSYGLWQRRFGGKPDVLGQTLSLSGRAREVIGVMPADLKFPAEAEVWTPLAPSEDARRARSAFWLPVIGRLRPGVSVEQAQTEMSAITARLEEQYPSNRGFGAYVVSLRQQIVGDIERPLLVLMASVGFVLLIACANLANLMLGRTAARRKELAIRTALGAGRWRIVRQIVTETFVLAVAGGALGVLFAWWVTQVVIRVGGEAIPRAESIRIDATVLAFTLALAAVCALLAGLVPALQASRGRAVEHLREGGRQAATLSGRTRSALVAAEVALAFVLLAGAGLLIRTFWSMQQVDRGFDSRGVATLTVSLPPAAYREAADVRAFYARLLGRVRALPGVESAALATDVLQPLVTTSSVFEIEGRPVPPPEQYTEYPLEVVSPGFFETLEIPLKAGRTFDERDHADAPRTVVINDTLARVGWPGQDPVGRRIRYLGDTDDSWMTVIGVIRDVWRAEVTREIRPELYMCSLQTTPRTQMLLVRTAGDPMAIVPSVRREVRALDPQLPVYAVGTLDGQIAETLGRPRFQALLLAGFAAIALLLAAIGIYGVTSHAVGQRTHEVGVRMALGARRHDVLRLILTQHIRPALLGIFLGVAGALVVSRSIRSLLFGVTASDPLTFAAMAAALLSVALVACWIPARRATRVDPLIALRIE